jgi:hypothetical protein
MTTLQNQNFLTLKNSIIKSIEQMDADYFLEEGEYLWEETIEELKAVTDFTDMSEILVDCEYWDSDDVIPMAKLHKI